MPYEWGTHIEILAVATSVYVLKQSHGDYHWEKIRPLNHPDSFSHPVIPASTCPLPNDYDN